jgi:hypothetical protein
VIAQHPSARRAVGIAAAVLAMLLVVAIVLASAPSPPPAHGRLKFGIALGTASRTPLQVAGTVTALRQLKAQGRPLVLHLYAGYTGPASWKAYRAFLGDTIGFYERAGFDIELVLRFAPFGNRGSPADVHGFVTLVRRVASAFGSTPRFVSLQITNEADRGASPASDGYFNRGDAAWNALVQGVIAAKATARARHFDRLKVGFNYGSQDRAFWRYLARHGGRALSRALDWIGIDTYPGTLTPLDAGSLSSGIANAIARTVRTTRQVYMPLARIPTTVALHFSEIGYATSVGRTYSMQATALKAAVDTVASLSRADHITEYEWFELRDASSQNRTVPAGLGLLQHDYGPKPAFSTYRRLIRDVG